MITPTEKRWPTVTLPQKVETREWWNGQRARLIARSAQFPAAPADLPVYAAVARSLGVSP